MSFGTWGTCISKTPPPPPACPPRSRTARQLMVDDWNNDDIMDLFVVRQGQPPCCWSKQRGGPLTEPIRHPTGPWQRPLAVGDLNNDLAQRLRFRDCPGHLECVFSGLTNRLRPSRPAISPSPAWLSSTMTTTAGWTSAPAAMACASGAILGQPGFAKPPRSSGLDKLVNGPRRPSGLRGLRQ